MYHRFDEKKYPSTNIQMSVFKEQIKIIDNLNYNFYNPEDLAKNFSLPKKEKKILITIDDAFSSFYEVAWPYLNEKQIPFILFVSTESVGKNGYMTWKQIKEIASSGLATIGNHSHTHEYLIDWEEKKIRDDLEKL